MTPIRWIRTLCAATLLAVCAAPASAAGTGSYPQRPITVIVSYAAGGTADIATRILAHALEQELHVSLVVENRPGASGIIGTTAALRAAPDGYTLLSASSEISLAAMMSPQVSDRVRKDLVPLAQTWVSPIVLAAKAGRDRTMSQWAEIARRSPGKISYATPGVLTPMHLVMESLLHADGLRLFHVPYNGGGRAVTDVLGGQVDLVAVALGTVLPQIEAKKIEPLAVLDDARSPLLPQVQSARDAFGKAAEGVPVVWFGWFAPRGLPQEASDKLKHALAQAVACASVRDKLRQAGLETRYLDSGQFAAQLKRERDYYGKAARLIEQ